MKDQGYDQVMSMKRVLLVSSECYPLVKTTGLADVVGALPAPLVANGIDAQVLLPGYSGVLEQVSLSSSKAVARWTDLFGGGEARLFRGEIDSGLKVWIIDVPGLYERAQGSLYVHPDPGDPARSVDWPDNHKRFAALGWVSARISESFVQEWTPDVVHLHDWQAAMAAVYLRSSKVSHAKSVFTIHNLAYKGVVPPDMGTAAIRQYLTELRLPPEVDSRIVSPTSFLETGLRYADHLTAVSGTYAREIISEPAGMGFADLLRARSARGQLSGIRNGIDMQVWNPASDQLLEESHHFSVDSLDGKSRAKVYLQRMLHLDVNPNHPLIGVVSRLSHQKGIDLLLGILPELLRRYPHLQVAISGMALEQSERKLETQILEIARHYRGRMAVRTTGPSIKHDEALPHYMQAGLDMLVVPSRFEPCGLTQLCALRYGTIPVVARTGGLADTVLDVGNGPLAQSAGTGFHFIPGSAEDLSLSLDHAIGAYCNKRAWHDLQIRAMLSDVGWEGPALEYSQLYQRLLES
jgi:starch synthase